jgi:hypothetical protein
MVQKVMMVPELAKSETQTAKAIKIMTAYDPDFDLEELCMESEEIFKEFYCNFLAGNMDYIEKVC